MEKEAIVTENFCTGGFCFLGFYWEARGGTLHTDKWQRSTLCAQNAAKLAFDPKKGRKANLCGKEP